MRRLTLFLRRWSGREGSRGPLIAKASPYDEFWYIALRTPFGWIRLHGGHS